MSDSTVTFLILRRVRAHRGLVAAGMPEEAALATAYAPPLWGFFAMRRLQRNSLL